MNGVVVDVADVADDLARDIIANFSFEGAFLNSCVITFIR